MSKTAVDLDPFYVTLGGVLKELRLRNGLAGDQLEHILTRAYLTRVEAGQVQPGFAILRKLCEIYRAELSLVLIDVEARLAGISRQERAQQVLLESKSHVLADHLKDETGSDNDKSIREFRLEELRAEVRQLDIKGHSKPDIARKLSISLRTVQRYLKD